MANEVPRVQRIDRSDESAIIQAIIRDGCCIIKNFTDGDLFPPETRRCTNLVGRSKTVREKWIVDPLIRKITRTFIDKTTNYYGETKHTYTSEAILSIAMTFDISPGAKAQRLHRDDKNFHVDYEDQTKNRLSFGLLVKLGGLYHAGGANITRDEQRIFNGFFFCRGFYRQEENPYLYNPTKNVLSWSTEVQRIMGYELSSPNIGFVHFKTPLQHLRGERIEKFGDFDASQEAK
ncbi:hypothetical protein BDW68DRAFT_174432 [Aspergillus falconensis]